MASDISSPLATPVTNDGSRRSSLTSAATRSSSASASFPIHTHSGCGGVGGGVEVGGSGGVCQPPPDLTDASRQLGSAVDLRSFSLHLHPSHPSTAESPSHLNDRITNEEFP